MLVVGTRFGGTYLDAAAASPSWEIGGIVARTRESVAAAGKKYGVDESCLHVSLGDALDACKDIDAVAIAVPNELHHELACQAIDHGLHVIVEKPLTETWDQALDLVRRVDARPGLKACVGQTLRGDVMIRLMAHFLREGIVGRVEQVLFESHWHWVVEDPSSHRNWRFALPDMFLDDIGIHQIDEIRMLAGDARARSVLASTWTPPSYPIRAITGASAASTWTMDGDIRVSYFGSMAARGHDAGWYGRVHVFGEQGCVFREASGQPYVYLDGKKEPIGLDDEHGDRLDEILPMVEFEKIAYVLEDFHDAIARDRAPVTGLHDNIHTLAILLAMKRSAAGGRVVDVATEFPVLAP